MYSCGVVRRVFALGTIELTSLLFAEDMVLMAFLVLGLQKALGWFAVECEEVGMRVSTAKSEAMNSGLSCLVWG